MKGVIQWLLGRRYRLVILAVAATPVIPIMATALMALETIRRGGVQGLLSAIAGTAGAMVLAWISGGAGILGLLVAMTMMSGVAMGVLVRWAGSLALAFQATLLLSVIGVVLAGWLWPDPGVLIGPALEQFLDLLRDGGATDQQLALVRNLEALFFGLLAAAVFAELIVALLLGLWWAALVSPEWKFGLQFRALKLGRVLGIPATVLMALSLVLNAALVQNLLPLALFGFWFQGLAVMHAWGVAKHWHPAFMAVVYGLLVTPLTGLVIFALASVGLVDNWIDLRAPLRPATSRE